MQEITPSSIQEFSKSVQINATPSAVWKALTEPGLMRQWMSETPIEIITDWVVRHPMVIRGDWYKTGFINNGIVLKFDPLKCLQYTHLSSLSRLPDKPENYTALSFLLSPLESGTEVTFTATNFPTESIYRHFAFYWNVAIVLLKRFVEQQLAPANSE
jgi:uncharacterized protein YndB with AHSA1/START domain